MQYGWLLSNVPTTWAYYSKYDFQDNMTCKKGRLVSLGHNDIRDLTAKILREICNDIKLETNLIPLTGERLQYRSAITGNESRLDIRFQSFWVRGQEVFLDMWIFDPNANRYLNITLPRCQEINEREKKRNYDNRTLQIEHGTFTPLVF